MAAEDHYGILGLTPRASQDEVKRAYRNLSKLYHPDKSAHLDEVGKRDHERRMIALNIAAEVLMSPRARRAYDLTRSEPESAPSAAASAAAAAYSAAPRPAAWYTAAAARAAARGFSAPRARQPAAGEGSHASCTPGPQPAAAASSGRGRAESWRSDSMPPKPRYQTGAKYTQRSRQARRMDPSQYTTHLDGRAAEFEGSTPSMPAPPPAGGNFEPGVPKHPTWLQRQLDIAREWEEAHCPAPTEDKYQWRKASDSWLRNLRERRRDREQQAEEDVPLSSRPPDGSAANFVAATES